MLKTYQKFSKTTPRLVRSKWGLKNKFNIVTTVRNASNNLTTSLTSSIAICLLTVCSTSCRIGGGKERNDFLIILQDFLHLNTLWACIIIEVSHKHSNGYLVPLPWFVLPWACVILLRRIFLGPSNHCSPLPGNWYCHNSVRSSLICVILVATSTGNYS